MKEDNLVRNKEDDRVAKRRKKEQQEESLRSSEASKGHQLSEIEDGQGKQRPPPSGWLRSLHPGVGDNQPTSNGEVRTPLKGVWGGSKSSPRAVRMTRVMKDKKQSHTLGSRPATGITVNGVNLLDLQKMRKTVQLSTPGRSKRTAQKKRRSGVSTTQSSENILKYQPSGEGGAR